MAKQNTKKSDAPSINIQSYIRVRPLSTKEKRAATLEFGKKDVTIKTAADSSKLSKILAFDRVFDEESKQIIVYNTVVKPMIKEVLQGYNCTIFAYGQTGTGKTYTMTGEQNGSQSSWEENVHAGIIPRAMQELFTELANQPCEYQVSVSYMELYNEKLRSLLKDSMDETNIQLIDDLEGGIILKGLLPTPVKSKEEAFRLMQQGADRRQIASTMMNLNSSRSHTIFTINVNIKENIVAGKDDVLRCGKLHLVDLAGSENVSKSGASENIHKTATGVNKRLAEASNINKSLLTLGRVITCLTENNPHIPYRESKLTRFLRDSLGGRTKTCIIGTISPAQSNLDETESTLNYAWKARSIKNKPEKNQTISKKDFMQVASEEIMKLKKDLEAVRQGEGFYISKESHEEMITRMKELDDQVKDWHEKYSRIKESYEQTKDMFSSLSADFDDKCAEYDELDRVFQMESERFKEKLSELAKEIYVREYFLKEYEKTENKLTDQAKTCKSVLESLFEQSGQLHDKIDRKQSNETKNVNTLQSFKENVNKKVDDFQTKLLKTLNEEKRFIEEVSNFAGSVYDVVCEEKGNVMSSLLKFEEKINDLAQAVAEKSQNNQKELKENIETAQALRDDSLKSSVNMYIELIESMVLPSVKNIRHQVERITETAEESKKIFRKYENRQAELISKVSKNHQFLVEMVQNMISEIVVIREQNQDSSKNAELIQRNVDQTSQIISEMLKKTEELQNGLKTLQSPIDLIKNGTKAVAVDMTSAAQRAQALEATVQSDFEKYESNQSKLIQAVQKQSCDQVCYVDHVINELEEKVLSLSAEEDSRFNNIQAYIDERIQKMQVQTNEEKTNVANLEDSLNKFCDYLSQTTSTYEGVTKQYAEEIKEKLQQTGLRFESLLRQKNDENKKNLKTIIRDHEVTQSIIQDLHREVETINYTEYVPLGTTPQRISKDKLQYPRKFESTAPKMELVKRLRERYSVMESVPSESLDLKKYLPAVILSEEGMQSPTENRSPSSVNSTRTACEESISFDNECTPEVRAHALRRKSTSLPDLKNSMEYEFAVPSSVENKENIKTRSGRKPVKTKIPDVKTKKKNVLLAVQEMNSCLNASH